MQEGRLAQQPVCRVNSRLVYVSQPSKNTVELFLSRGNVRAQKNDEKNRFHNTCDKDVRMIIDKKSLS